MTHIKNKLRVLHYPQISAKPFIVEVGNEYEAWLIENVLADQHLFLLDERIIGDFNNIIEVQMFEQNPDDGYFDWVSYYNEEEGLDWDEYVLQYFEKDGI